ncbi:hypothetical protein D3C85_1721970 [compost metagenome]
MSSRFTTMVRMRWAWTRMASTVAATSAGSGARASDSAMPISPVSGVRRSCDTAASSELRSCSDSIDTSACCATST